MNTSVTQDASRPQAPADSAVRGSDNHAAKDHNLKDRKDSEEAKLTEYDKTLADSFPASDPPVQP